MNSSLPPSSWHNGAGRLSALAIGIDANAAIFSYVDGILLLPSPYADVARMVRVLEKPPWPSSPCSPAMSPPGAR